MIHPVRQPRTITRVFMFKPHDGCEQDARSGRSRSPPTTVPPCWESRTLTRLATGTAFAILFLIASDLGREFVLGALTWLGWLLRYHFVPWSITSDQDQISITAMIFGAIASAAIADLAVCGREQTGLRRRLKERIGHALRQPFPGRRTRA